MPQPRISKRSTAPDCHNPDLLSLTASGEKNVRLSDGPNPQAVRKPHALLARYSSASSSPPTCSSTPSAAGMTSSSVRWNG